MVEKKSRRSDKRRKDIGSIPPSATYVIVLRAITEVPAGIDRLVLEFVDW